MTDSAYDAPAESIALGFSGAERQRIVRGELRTWATLAVASLALAGVFALMLALSRLPGIEKIFPWAVGFFAKGLVIHVTFSLIIWFLAVFALMAAMATFDSSDRKLRFAALGTTGATLVAMSFPFLLAPVFLGDSVASLNNYIPVIIHRSYYFGLTLLAIGIALPAARLLANVSLPFRELRPLTLAMSAGAAIYFIALVCIAAALWLSWGSEPSRAFHERLFWGGGHVLQFLYALMMLTGWFTLIRTSLGERSFDTDIFRLSIVLLAVFTLPAPFFYKVFEPFSLWQTEAFRRLQFVLALPSLIIAIGGLLGVLAARRRGALPWHDPALVALVLSAVVFGVGGIMGFFITGSDTRTPAHYHGVTAGVNLALMGLFLRCFLPTIGRALPQNWVIRGQILLFGIGQLIACVGLFWAGGYGALRKTPGVVASLADGAVLGMYLHGIGALIAVVGGVMFVLTVIRALMRDEHGLFHIPSDGPVRRDRKLSEN